MLNPRNMMPDIANRSRVGDTMSFSRERETSSIPKTNEAAGTKWIYPSPQQFFNALRRRNKIDEEDRLEEGGVMNDVI